MRTAITILLGALIVLANVHAYRAGYRAGCRVTEARWQIMMRIIEFADRPKANL